MRLSRWTLSVLTVVVCGCSGSLEPADDSLGDTESVPGSATDPTAEPDMDGEAGDSPTGSEEGSGGGSEASGDPEDPEQGSLEPGSPGAAQDSEGGEESPNLPPPSDRCDEVPVLAIERQSLRLNDWQFRQSLTQLFPFDVELDPFLDSTVVGDGLFSTFPGANEMLANHTRDLVELSESLAMQSVNNLDQLLPCADDPGSESECVDQFIDDFGARAFRRPLSAAEREHFRTLYDDLRTGAEPLDFELAIGGLVQAFVLSPETLYLLERGEPSSESGLLVLRDFEVASRLSYLFWNSPPDDELLALAQAGRLQDAGTLREQAERLMADSRAEVATGRFVGEWFGVADKTFVDHAPEPMARSWEEEVTRFVSHAVQSGASLDQLLNTDQTLVNQPLAEHYGIEPNPSQSIDDWQLVTLPDGRRGGLLTTAQFAAATSHNNATSIIHRGKAVRERLLCGQLGTPDPAFLEEELELPPDPTVRDRMDSRLDQAVCGGCHILMDPIGIGMEDLDENGLFRDTYPDGKDVDAQGELLGTSLEAEFEGSVALAHRIADSELFRRCAADQWLRYSVGRSDLGAQRSCIVDDLGERAGGSGGSIAELLISVVQSDAFIYRTEEAQ